MDPPWWVRYKLEIMPFSADPGLRVTFKCLNVVKLRSRSRSGESQVRVRKVKETEDLDLSYTLFLVFTTTHQELFSCWS